MIILETGNQIVTDSIILEGEVEVNESFITGESDVIYKKQGDTLLSGSFVVSGKCKAEETVEKPAARKRTAKSRTEAEVPDVAVSLDKAGKSNARNSNEKILELHKAGKSNMAIARELGLGIGEVKLVIDLFEGM